MYKDLNSFKFLVKDSLAEIETCLAINWTFLWKKTNSIYLFLISSSHCKKIIFLE